MSNPDPAGDAAAASPRTPSREELLARIQALEAERDRLRAEVAASEHDEAATLRHVEERVRTVADTAPAMLWITDRENRCVFLSRGWYDYSGQTEEEGLGFGWLRAVHPGDRDQSERVFREAAHARQPFALDHRLRRSDGEFRWVLDEGRPWFDEDGRWRGYVGCVIDVHDREMAAEALRRSEAKYRALFESIDNGFCVIQLIFDDEGNAVDYRFVETNPAFVAQTGLENALGKRARQLMPGLEEHWFRTYGEVARTGKPIRFENGSDVMGRWFDVFAFRVEEPERRKVALLFTDITEQRRAERERERLLRIAEHARSEAETANRAKAEFLAAMSHELRTPLNAIAGYVEILDLEIHGALAGAQRDALVRITANQRHLLTLINDILSFARLEAGRMEFDLRSLSAADMLSSMEWLVVPQAEAKGIAYTVKPCDPALHFRADAERVRQILLNLVGNAIKFTPAGGWVVLSCEAADGWVSLHVQDSGIGIPADEQQRIFDPFQQVGRRLNQPQEGVGLGLAISRDLARAMSGDLTVHSTPGEGSTFTLRLPRAFDDHSP
jgi:PAS domain S-box-containing protein